MDINKSLIPQGISRYTQPQSRVSPSATTAGHDVRVHSESSRLVVGSQLSGQDNAQPLNTDLSVYDILPIVRDGVTGCVETRSRASPIYYELVGRIKEHLAGPLTEESLKEIDKLYNRILNECDYSTEEIKELDNLKIKIAAHYFKHLEKQKNTLITELNFCFSSCSTGGADALFEQFIHKVKLLYSDFTPVMQEILYDVGLTILSSQFDHDRISRLKDQLGQHNRSGNSSHKLSPAESVELMECQHAAKLIVRRQGKHRPSVLENYLDRLTKIVERPQSLAESDHCLLRQALNRVVAEMADTIEMNAGSDTEMSWHRMFFEAVLDVRFPSEFMTAHHEIISKLPPERWGLEELIGFITVLRSSGQTLGYCSAEFLSLLAKMDGNDNEQPASMPTPAGGCSEEDDDRAIEHDEHLPPKVFTDEDRRKELEIFLKVVALEISGDFYHAKYDKHYSDWHVLVEMILGKRALTSPDARRAIKLLVNLSKGGVKTSNLHFVDATGDIREACNQLDVVIKKISEKKPDNITIQQTGHCTKASVHLWLCGQVFHRFEIPAVTESGIPYESLAMAIQLLAGKHSVRKLFSYQGKALEFRYYKPHRLEASQNLK